MKKSGYIIYVNKYIVLSTEKKLNKTYINICMYKCVLIK